MNIFGIGGAELVIILVIMLVVAGPQRMIRWAYILGQYVAKLQKLWQEAAAVLQKEFDEAGVDVQVPKKIPTKGEIQRQVRAAANPLTRPLEDVKKEIGRDMDNLRISTQIGNLNEPPAAKAAASSKPSEPPVQDNGKAPENGNANGFGTWSGGGHQDEGERS
ncbi:MAG: hypothetical protein IT320_27635 [Anaerolineae bacterium]|nr:hypothetical protein [Anaerolineae bacterium]